MSIEDRLIEAEQEHLNPYEKLRKLQARRQQHKEMQQNNLAKEHATVEEVSDTQVDTTAAKLNVSKFKPKLKPKFKWAQDNGGELCIKPEEKKSLIKVEPKTIQSSDRILHFLGYNIDLTAKKTFFMSSYQKSFVESRSQNFLMAKFSELKSGAYHMILSALGVSTEELKTLRDDALTAAIEEATLLYEQTIYNSEVFKLFSSGKKDKAKLLLFDESLKQLDHKMSRYGKKGFFTPERVNEFEQKAVRRILQDLLEEQQNMAYQRDFV